MSDRFKESGAITLDTNVINAVTASFLPLDGSVYKCLYVVSKTGTHATHVVQFQGSPDAGTTWFALGSAVSGEGALHGEICLCQEIRAKVTTAEGGTSTCDIYFLST